MCPVCAALPLMGRQQPLFTADGQPALPVRWWLHTRDRVCAPPPAPLQASFGGAGMGIAFGLAASLLLSLMFEDPIGELWVVVVAAYSLFMVTDEVRVLGMHPQLAPCVQQKATMEVLCALPIAGRCRWQLKAGRCASGHQRIPPHPRPNASDGFSPGLHACRSWECLPCWPW